MYKMLITQHFPWPFANYPSKLRRLAA
jgi:hypothetical protein